MSVEAEAKGVVIVTLEGDDHSSLPGLTPGAHIVVELPNGLSRAYSLDLDAQQLRELVRSLMMDVSRQS
ncbi:MAG: hypothetical protein ACR2GP_01380, partial [Burkholderiaceae bacterium]